MAIYDLMVMLSYSEDGISLSLILNKTLNRLRPDVLKLLEEKIIGIVKDFLEKTIGV